ncbi:Phosphate-binding protein PstS 1 precursor [Vibrio thalassae]|uniref:Phosphate-binding protein PstS 1 n=1 Tax=Vibrio thalassae TaxID=1243014 RepID=A0A240EQ61_9VIBR|nr:phosphate ABC transporter substrate-binding protein [Vibrio thalassae]SNX50754.1 Phosphate-binding protein PstS 1 precursor [Vibrio thalassae]
MRFKTGFIRLLACSLCFIPVVSQAADTDTFAGQSGTINIAGGTAHIPVMKLASRAIMKSNPDIRITIAGGGSGVGAQQVAKGLVDIGNTGRALKPSEAEQGLVTFPFKDLTQQQVIDIYSGKITNWKALGGEDRSINLFTRDEASGTRAVFFKKMLNSTAIVTNANVIPSNGAMKTAIARDPGAIGYSSVGYIDDTVKAPALDGVHPTNEACASGEYKIVRKLYMNTKGEPQGLVSEFVDYIYSPQGAEYISASGYIPLSKL